MDINSTTIMTNMRNCRRHQRIAPTYSQTPMKQETFTIYTIERIENQTGRVSTRLWYTRKLVC